MKYNDLYSENQLDKFNMANMFDVIQRGPNSYFNISKTIIFNNVEFIEPENFYQYQLKETDTWTGISFKYYKTYKLWWLICKFNDIKNPFRQIIPGKIIKIPSLQLMQTVLSQLANN